MKKIVVIIVVAALCTQSINMQAMETARRYAGKAKAAIGRGAQQMGAAVSQGMASARMKKDAFVAWAGPFLSEVGAALKARNFNALPDIVRKYKSQSAAAGAVAVAILTALGLMISALSRSEMSAEQLAEKILTQKISNPTKEENVFLISWIRALQNNDNTAMQQIFMDLRDNSEKLRNIRLEVIQEAQQYARNNEYALDRANNIMNLKIGEGVSKRELGEQIQLPPASIPIPPPSKRPRKVDASQAGASQAGTTMRLRGEIPDILESLQSEEEWQEQKIEELLKAYE
jgi:hypothetical protein